MDNYNLYGSSSTSSNSLPTSLDSILNENTETKDYFYNMDSPGRTELINYANDFQSKEELERYIYYLTGNKFS